MNATSQRNAKSARLEKGRYKGKRRFSYAK
jgi:hypothetical protein